MPLFVFLAQGVPHAFREKDRLMRWLSGVVKAHGKRIGSINFVLVSDESLLRYNIDYLGHHDLTDVITFPQEGGDIGGDILMSLPRIRENARTAGVSTQQEMRRVMVHGVLHLLGHEDRTLAQKSAMREQEDRWLDRYTRLSAGAR